MIDLKDVPVDSIHKILVHLDIERRRYEETDDDKRFDHIYGDAAKVREWLTSIIGKREPGLVVVIKERDKT